MPDQPIYAQTPQDWQRVLELLTTQPVLAVDTESNSLYAYQENICLIQVSTQEVDCLIDPLAGLDLAPLGRILADPRVEKVFHAAKYDVMCFKRDLGFDVRNLFDTMWAARILGWPRVGLGNVLKEVFGVRTNKRFQRYNWGHRPIKPEALAYASGDTHYLLALRELQIEALEREGRLEEAREVFAELAATDPVSLDFSPQDVWRVKGVYDLNRHQQAIVQQLVLWRDEQAQRRDCPHFKILHDKVLVRLAKAQPDTIKALAKVKGVRPAHVKRYGTALLEQIEQGTKAKPPKKPPRSRRHTQQEIDRFMALKAWRKQRAAQRGVDPDVVIGNATLWAVAEYNPQTVDDLVAVGDLGPWKRETYGETLLRVLADMG